MNPNQKYKTAEEAPETNIWAGIWCIAGEQVSSLKLGEQCLSGGAFSSDHCIPPVNACLRLAAASCGVPVQHTGRLPLDMKGVHSVLPCSSLLEIACVAD